MSLHFWHWICCCYCYTHTNTLWQTLKSVLKVNICFVSSTAPRNVCFYYHCCCCYVSCFIGTHFPILDRILPHPHSHTHEYKRAQTEFYSYLLLLLCLLLLCALLICLATQEDIGNIVWQHAAKSNAHSRSTHTRSLTQLLCSHYCPPLPPTHAHDELSNFVFIFNFAVVAAAAAWTLLCHMHTRGGSLAEAGERRVCSHTQTIYLYCCCCCCCRRLLDALRKLFLRIFTLSVWLFHHSTANWGRWGEWERER